MSRIAPTVILPPSVNKFFDRTYDYILPRLWNSLPTSLKNLNDKEIVKQLIKKWYLSSLKE